MKAEEAIGILTKVGGRDERESEALQLAVGVLRKQIPMKPKSVNTLDEHGDWDGGYKMVCPVCGVTFCTAKSLPYVIWYHDALYCHCGQKIDWRKEVWLPLEPRVDYSAFG